MKETFDFIVVGAGSAGCVLAHRLSADPTRSVLLLEAGGSDWHPLLAPPLAYMLVHSNPRLIWHYATEPEEATGNRIYPQPRGKVLGGSSSINGNMYIRGNSLDYDHWAEIGLSGWSYADVLPYFRKAESNWRGETEYHGGTGPLAVSKHPPFPIVTERMFQTAEKLGYRVLDDFHGAEQAGFSVGDFTIKTGRRHSTARAYLSPSRRRSNLTVTTRATVGRILIDGRRAIGIEYTKDALAVRVHAGEVILCAGAFGSPQLLMLSGVGPADHLRDNGIAPVLDHPNVGKNLHDHPHLASVFEASGPYAFHKTLRLDQLTLASLSWALTGSGPLASMPFAGQGFVTLDPSQSSPDTQFQLSPVAMTARPWFPGWRSSTGHKFTAAAMQLRPSGRGEVTLRSSNPNDFPRIRHGLFEHPDDKKAARAMLRFMRKFMTTSPMSSLVARELFPGPGVQTDEELDAHIRMNIYTSMHAVGTCAMGTSADSVLDAELKLRGIDGLRVVDASVMPSIVSGNTNAPVIMIAEKAADMILNQTELRSAANASPKQKENAI